LTTRRHDVILDNMKAELIYRERRSLQTGGFIEQVIWKVPKPVPPCLHSYKYRLVYIVDGVRVVGYDNERGKGDHKHFNHSENQYVFRNVRMLMSDFMADVDRWNNGYRHS